jgi:hypothetical protein
MLRSRSLLALLVVGVSVLVARPLHAQVTYTDQLRTIAVSSPTAAPSSASTAPGDFSAFNTSVSSGFSTVNSVSIQSLLLNSGVSLLSTFNVQTAGGISPPIPPAVLQHLATFTIASPQAAVLLASDSLPTTANFGINTTLTGPGGVTIFSGRSSSSTGTVLNLAPGTYTFSTIVQVSTAGGASGAVTGTVSATLDLQPAVDTPTSIVYQGQLKQAGQPANGEFDMTFQAFNAPTGGSALSGPISVLRVQVTNGLFTTPVALPAAVWNDDRVWLEVSVAFPVSLPVVLSPRQAVQPAPKAVWASNAGSAASVPWTGITGVPSNVSAAFSPWFAVPAGIAYTSGNVGIGLDVPAAPLHVRDSSAGVTPNASSLLVLERATGGYLSMLAGNSGETGILFGRPVVGGSGAGIIYNNPGTPGGLQFRTDTNATRLSISNTGDAAFSNTVTAPNFAYTTPITSFAMFTDASMRSRNGAPVRGIALGSGGAFLDNGTIDGLVADLNLPNGATVTGIRAYVVDNSAGVDVNVTVFSYNPLTGYVVIGSAVSGGASSAPQTVDIPASVLIDNSIRGYIVRFACTSVGAAWDSNIAVRAVRVQYTMPRPVP